jgi:hypothetical protein
MGYEKGGRREKLGVVERFNDALGREMEAERREQEKEAERRRIIGEQGVQCR